MVEHSCDDRHDDDVVSEGPKKVYFDENIAPFDEPHQSQYFVQILRKNDRIRSVDVQL